MPAKRSSNFSFIGVEVAVKVVGTGKPHISILLFNVSTLELSPSMTLVPKLIVGLMRFIRGNKTVAKYVTKNHTETLKD